MLLHRMSRLVIVSLMLLVFAMVVGLGQEIEVDTAVIEHPVDIALDSIGTAVEYCGQGILDLVARFSNAELPATLQDPLGVVALITVAAVLMLLSKAFRYLFGFALLGSWTFFILRVTEVL